MGFAVRGSTGFDTSMLNVLEDHRGDIARLCSRVGARRLDVFGSATRADFDQAESDLDFVVDFDALPPTQYADAYFTLKEGLEAMLGRRVDLVTEAGLENPYFRERILGERQPLYAP